MKKPETHLTLTLISSLLHQIPLIPSFKGKWSIIKTKLHLLHTQLHHLSDLHPLSSDLLLSVTQTLNEALLLATKCKESDPSSGKLRTQSDMDSIAARLDQHIKDSELLIKSGVLEENAVGCSGGGGGLREAVRIEARSLITRLQIGNHESKNAAMDGLLGLIQESDKNVLIAVAQGVVPVLVRLLDSSSVEIKEKAVAGISRVSVVESSKHVLIAEGTLLPNHLLRVLESGSGFAKEKACVTLQALSFMKENARAIGSRGGISSLLEICQGGTHTAQAVAAGVLRNLAGFPEIKLNFVEENAVPVLIALSASGTALAQENSVSCLSNLVLKDEKMKLLVVKEGGIECLKNFWDAAPMAQSLEVAVELLLNLASCIPIAEIIVSNGFIPRLVILLNSGVSGVRIVASRAVYELGFCTKTRKEFGDAGCIPLLVKMLDGKVEEIDAAAKTLSSLMQYAGNRRIFRKEDKGIVVTVQLLDPSLHNLEKKNVILILSLIAQSKKCKKQIIAAGACAFLHKLVEMDIDGAKKLLEKLGRGKVWGVFART